MILIAEEECTSIQDVEKTLKQAYKSADANYRKSQQTQNQSSVHEAMHSKYFKKKKKLCIFPLQNAF